MSTIQIRNVSQVERLRPVILEKIANMYYVHQLTFKEDGTCLVNILSQAPNRQYEDLHIQEQAVVLTTQGVARPIKRYCDDMINVTVQGPISLARLEKPIIKIGDGVKTHFLQEEEFGVYRDVVTGEEFLEYGGPNQSCIWDAKDNYLRNGDVYIEYGGQGAGGMTSTNGQLKRYDITIPATNKMNFSHMKSWSRVTYQGSEYVCDGQESTPKGIAQANARLSQFKSPSVPVGMVETFSVYMGKLKFSGHVNGHEYRDGFAFLSSEFLSYLFNQLNPDKFHFTHNCCDGLGVQCRPWLNKVFGETVSREYMQEFIAWQGWEEKILVRGQISEEDVQNFIQGVRGKGPFVGKLITITDDPALSWRKDMLTDCNGLKAPFNPNEKSALEILTITEKPHESEGGARTSTQLIQSLMIADSERTVELMYHLAEKHIKRKIEQVMAERGKAPSWKMFQGDFDYQQILSCVMPHFGREQYAPLWHSMLNRTLEGCITAIRRLNLPCKGAHLYLTTDPAADFGHKILKINPAGEMEVLCPLAAKRKLKRLAAIKYPKQHFQEFGKCRVITPDEYEARLKETDLPPRIIKLIMQHVWHMSTGYLAFPAIREIANMLSGLDYDGDSVVIFFEELILDILWEIQPKAVIIDENDVSVPDAIAEVMMA